MSQNIPVILVSSKADTDKYITFIEPNNITMGQEQAKYIVKKLNGKGNVIMLSGIAGASAAEDRLAGARGIWAQNPGIKELGQAYCDWTPAKGKQATEGFLAAHPQIDGIWSDSGVMAVGAIQAFQEANRKVPPVTGENFNGYLRMLVTQKLDGFAILYPPSIGLTAVELAIKTLQGQQVPYYISIPMPTYADADIAKLYDPNMPDDYWPGSALPQAWLDKVLKK
jgi:ribose transport system substrate-binding protein